MGISSTLGDFLTCIDKTWALGEKFFLLLLLMSKNLYAIFELKQAPVCTELPTAKLVNNLYTNVVEVLVYLENCLYFYKKNTKASLLCFFNTKFDYYKKNLSFYSFFFLQIFLSFLLIGPTRYFLIFFIRPCQA